MDFLVVMRSIDKLDKYFIDRSEEIDENMLAKQFTTRSFSFITSDASERRNQLKNDLK
jgi:flagellar biosynthesis regulator FlaF